jgi:alpha(1,3/1,4) fucosyltransferase
MKKKLKIAFSDFWGGFEYNPTNKTNYDNVFYRILSERFEIEISTNPDILIFSVFGNNHVRYNCTKVFYTGENIRPNYNNCDYSISFDYLNDDRNLRFPLSAITLYEHGITDNFDKDIDFDKIKTEKNKFCNFIFSNPRAELRNKLFSELSNYKSVDSGGRAMNNIGYFVGDKLEFQNQYKFSIAFENSEFDGYTTEKIVHPKLVNSIPIYWGNPVVYKDWNTKSFINFYDFDNLSAVIEFIKEVDNNDDLYYNILKERHFNLNKSKDLDINSLIDFFEKITM